MTLFTLNYLPKSFDTGFVFDPRTARLALFLSPISSTLCLNSLWSISLICIELHCQSAGMFLLCGTWLNPGVLFELAVVVPLDTFSGFCDMNKTDE